MNMFAKPMKKHPDATPFVGKGLLAFSVIVLALMTNVASAAIVKVQCLGDSLTAGFTDAPTWSVPFTFGYRGPLYTRLADAGYNFQFVGESLEPMTDVQGIGVPKTISGPNLRAMLPNQDKHRGYGGATTSNLLNGGTYCGVTNPDIAGIMNQDDPDVILLMIGINGVSDAMTNLDPLVNRIVTTKPGAQLIVAQITPRSSYQQAIVNYNNYIKNTLVPYYRDTLHKNVSTVDQYSNLLTNPNNLASIDTSLYCDSAHLKPVAYDRLAQTWFEGIQAVVDVPEPGSLSLLTGLGALLAVRLCWRSRRRLPACKC